MKPLILIAGTMDVHKRYYELVQKSGMNAQMLSYRAGEAFPYSSLQSLSFRRYAGSDAVSAFAARPCAQKARDRYLQRHAAHPCLFRWQTSAGSARR